MQSKTGKSKLSKAEKKAIGERTIAMRMRPPLCERFELVRIASRRSATSIVLECLEKALPELEKRFSVAA